MPALIMRIERWCRSLVGWARPRPALGLGGTLVLLSLGLTTTVGSCGQPFSGASIVRGWTSEKGDACDDDRPEEIIPGSRNTQGLVNTCRRRVEWRGFLGISPSIRRAIYLASLAVALWAVLVAFVPGWVRYATRGPAAKGLLVVAGSLTSYGVVDTSFIWLGAIPGIKTVDATLLTVTLTLWWVALISLGWWQLLRAPRDFDARWMSPFRPAFVGLHGLHAVGAIVILAILAIPEKVWGYASHLVGLATILLGVVSARRRDAARSSLRRTRG